MEKMRGHWTDDQLMTSSADLAPASDSSVWLDAGLSAPAREWSPPPTATADSWTSAVSGNWTKAADWSAGVPTSSNNATIAVSGNYTVAINAADVANTLTIDDTAATVADANGGTLSLTTTLSIEAGTFSLGAGSALSAAAITIAQPGVFVSTGTNTISSAIVNAGTILSNAGTLALGGGGSLGGTIGGGSGVVALINGFAIAAGVTETTDFASGAQFGFNGNFAELSGAGTFSSAGTVAVADLGYQGVNGVEALVLGDGVTFQNVGTVNDSGQIYFGLTKSDTITVVNAAGATFDLTSDDAGFNQNAAGSSAAFINNGTLTKTGTGGAGGIGASYIYAAVTNTGTITASKGTLALAGGGVLGGTIGGGAGTVALIGDFVPSASNSVTTSFAAGAQFGFSGAFAELSGAGTFTSAGTVAVADLGYNGINGVEALVLGGGVTFQNGGTVNDAGQIYYGFSKTDTSTFTNAAGATFNLTTDDAGFNQNVVGSTATFINAGTLAKTGTGGAGGIGASYIYAAVTNTGTITASKGTLALAGGGVLGGTIGGGGGTVALIGDFVPLASNSVTTSFAAGAQFGLGTNLAELSGAGTFISAGTVAVADLGYQGINGTEALVLGGGVTFQNIGTINDSGQIYYGLSKTDAVTFINAAAATFNLTSDDAGFNQNVAGSTATFLNAGTLAKTGIGGAGGIGASYVYAAITNTGTITASVGTLVLAGGGALGGAIGGGAGTVALIGDFVPSVSNSVTTSFGSGAQFGFNGTAAELSGAGTFTSAGTVAVADLGYYGINGVEALILGNGVTFQNIGTVNDSGQIYFGLSKTDIVTFINAAGATFNLTSDDAGFNQNAGGSTADFINNGTLAKTGTGGAGGIGASYIYAAVTNTGTITATLGTLALAGGGVLGGTIGGGAGTVALIDDFAIAPKSTETTNFAAGAQFGFNGNFAELSGAGTFTSAGTVAVADLGYNGINGVEALVLGSFVTVQNIGTVNDAGQIYFGLTKTDAVTFINAAGATFNLTTDDAGFNQNAAGSTATFINAGTLAKTGTGGDGGIGASYIYAAVTNTGIITATTGTLALASSVSNAGKLLATNGGVLNLASATLSNLSGTTLTGGTYEADAKSIIELSNNATIATDSASITLSGAASTIQAFNTNSNTQVTLDSELSSITAAGALTLLNGRNFTAVANNGTFSLAGLLSLGGVTFAATKLAIAAGGTVSGSGTLKATVTDAGTIAASGGTLLLSGAVSGTGALTATAGAVIDLTKGGSLTETISGAGTLQLDGAIAYSVAGGTIAIGFVNIDAGASLSGNATITGSVVDAGTLAASGGTLAIDGAITGAGALSAAAGAVLDLTQGTALTETITGAGTLQLDGGAYTLGAAAGGISSVVVDAGASLAGSGTLAGALVNNGAVTTSTGTLTVDGAVSGTGSFAVGTGATLDFADGGTLAGAISGAGTLELGGAFLLSGALTTAELLINTGASLSGTGTLTQTIVNNGTIAASGGTLTVKSAITGGTLAADAAATLLLSDAGSFAGTLAGPGTVNIGEALTLSGSAALDAATINDAFNITLAANTALTEAAGSTLNITSATAKTKLTVSGPGSASFSNAGTLLASGLGSTSISVAIINSGNVSVGSGTLAFLGAVTNNGIVDQQAGILSIKDTVGGTGTLDVGATGTLSLLLGAGAGQTVDFLASTGLLDLTKPADFKGTIENFGASNQIDLLKTKETSFTFSNNILTVKDGTKTEATLHFAGTYTQSDFALASDGHSGTVITFV
jgi:hypothetical protein